MQKSIAELDDSVAKATEIRRKQHAEFVTLTANNATATELLKLAVNRLNKFYAPWLVGCLLQAPREARHGPTLQVRYSGVTKRPPHRRNHGGSSPPFDFGLCAARGEHRFLTRSQPPSRRPPLGVRGHLSLLWTLSRLVVDDEIEFDIPTASVAVGCCRTLLLSIWPRSMFRAGIGVVWTHGTRTRLPSWSRWHVNMIGTCLLFLICTRAQARWKFGRTIRGQRGACSGTCLRRSSLWKNSFW